MPLAPLYGKSWKPWLSGASDGPVRGPSEPVGFEMMECRALMKGDWKVIFMAPPYGQNEWRLCSLRDDPRELDDRADAPERFAEMKAEWEAYARSVGYIEAGDVKQLETSMPPEQFFQFTGLE